MNGQRSERLHFQDCIAYATSVLLYNLGGKIKPGRRCTLHEYYDLESLYDLIAGQPESIAVHTTQYTIV